MNRQEYEFCTECKENAYKRIKRLFIVVVLLVWSMGIVFGWLLHAYSDSSEVVSASAEISNDLDATIDDYDISNYPTANYFDVTVFKPYSQSPNNAITAVSNGLVNSIIISTSVAPDSPSGSNGYTVTNVKLGQACPYLKAGETYTLSAESDSLIKKFIITNYYGISVEWNFGSSLTITGDYLNYWIIMYGFYIQAGQSAGDCEISEIMINKGEVAYPYTPYYKSLYNAGVVDGKEVGYDEGYEQGRLDGLKTVENGIFENANIDIYANFVYESTGEPSLNGYGFIAPSGTYSVSRGVVDFSQFIDDIRVNVPSGFVWGSTQVGISFDESIQLQDISLLGFGSVLSFDSSIKALDVQGGIYYFAWKKTEYGWIFSYPDEYKDVNLQISLLEFSIASGEANLNFSLQSDLTSYGYGYEVGKDVGKKEGLEVGYADGFKVGKDEGLLEGEEIGYVRGLETANNGSFVGLIGAMADAPVGVVKQFLNFEILGVNFLGLFSGALTLLFVIKILKIALLK